MFCWAATQRWFVLFVLDIFLTRSSLCFVFDVHRHNFVYFHHFCISVKRCQPIKALMCVIVMSISELKKFSSILTLHISHDHGSQRGLW